MNRRPFLALVAAAACAALVGCTNRGATGGSGGGSLSSGDRQFVTMAAQGSWAEIATGELAQKNGGSNAVRQYGARMIKDHGMANAELEAIAGRLGIVPPKGPDAKHQAEAAMLAKLSGAEFDRHYAAHMVKDHEMTVALFEKQSRGGESAELRQFATKQLPILQDHLRMAQSMSGALVGAADAAPMSSGSSGAVTSGSSNMGTSSGTPSGVGATGNTGSGSTGSGATGGDAGAAPAGGTRTPRAPRASRG